jgi:glycosyltransferase involved in cell wall biosynthesis
MEKLVNIRQFKENRKPINGSAVPQTKTFSLISEVKPLSSRSSAIRSDRAPDLICFSHLRWDFVYQRPQHLLTRCARDRRVFFVEEPIFSDASPRLDISQRDCGVWVVVPHLTHGMDESEIITMQQAMLIDDLILQQQISEYICWYYTPMARAFTQNLEPLAIIYDCMDELSAFKNPPPKLKDYEADLMECADLVFTGGYSLFEAKRDQHKNIHPFPSSIEAEHFQKARQTTEEPADQRDIPHPRLGFFGVIDERFDIELIDGLARSRPDWNLVMIGPIVKIDPNDLPKHPNIHYLGGKSYQELPAYLSGWDIAMLPFARNESTRFISPTKTPEYLAAGVPVVSTSIRDVVRPYGQEDLVKIADTVEEVIKAVDMLLHPSFDRQAWLRRVDTALLYNSWDRTWQDMAKRINKVLTSRYPAPLKAVVSTPGDGLRASVVGSQISAD